MKMPYRSNQSMSFRGKVKLVGHHFQKSFFKNKKLKNFLSCFGAVKAFQTLFGNY